MEEVSRRKVRSSVDGAVRGRKGMGENAITEVGVSASPGISMYNEYKYARPQKTWRK